MPWDIEYGISIKVHLQIITHMRPYVDNGIYSLYRICNWYTGACVRLSMKHKIILRGDALVNCHIADVSKQKQNCFLFLWASLERSQPWFTSRSWTSHDALHRHWSTFFHINVLNYKALPSVTPVNLYNGFFVEVVRCGEKGQSIRLHHMLSNLWYWSSIIAIIWGIFSPKYAKRTTYNPLVRTIYDVRFLNLVLHRLFILVFPVIWLLSCNIWERYIPPLAVNLLFASHA